MERKRTELAGDGKKMKKQRQDVDELRVVVNDFLLSSQANGLQSNATEANLAFEAGCELVGTNPLDDGAWLLVVQVVSSCKGRFELRVTKQIEGNIQQAVGQVFTSGQTAPVRLNVVEQCWETLQTEVGFCLSLDNLFSLMTTHTLLSTPTFVLKALLQACQNFGSSRKLFETVVNHAELLHLLISLACTNTVAWDVLYTCLFEHDVEDDLAKACPRVAISTTTVASGKKATNQNNWKQVFWPKLFASRSNSNQTWPRGWGTVLCKMHRKRHGEAAAFTTQIWFELLFHSANEMDLGELVSLLEHGPLFYSPTSDTDVAALGQFTADYVTKGQLDIAVIQRLLVVDHRCVEPHFTLLLDLFPKGMELALCLAEAFIKTRRLPAWIELMGSREFAFADLAEQTEFRESFAKLLQQHLLEHQTLQAWKAFLENEGLNQVMLCAFEAFILILPCQLDHLPRLEQAIAKCPLLPLPTRDVCSTHSLVRLHATCRKFREILCVGEDQPTEAVFELPLALREYIEATTNAKPSRKFLSLQTSKEQCLGMWSKIACGKLVHLLDLAWFFELPKMRHYFVKFFTRAEEETTRGGLDLVLRFPIGYLSPKQLGKIVLHVLDTAKPDTIAKVLLRPRSAPVTSQLFPTCQAFIKFVCQLESPKDAMDLIKRFPIDEDSLPVLLGASPSYLHAATLVKWEPQWIERFLTKYCAKADTLWMLASCLNVAKQQPKSMSMVLKLNVGLGLKLALGNLHLPEAQAFVNSLSETFYLFSDAELVQQLVPLLFAFCLELLHQSALGGVSRGESALERTLERASTQQVAQLIDTLQAYAWSVDPDKQQMACQAFRVLFEFGVRGNYETIVKRRTRSLLVALARLAQMTDGDEAWRALCAFVSSGGNERLDISSRDIVVVLTATQACRNAGKMKFFQILLESFPTCITGDASAGFVDALCVFEAVVVTAAPTTAAAALGEFSKVCEKLQGLEKTLRHHAVAMICNHVDLVLGLHAAGAEDRKYERIGFYLLDLCGEYELNQLNAVLGSGADDKLAAERRRFVKSLTDSHTRNHVFRGKI
ncbi:hypothetical protein BASA81_001193 [Batrachochytrium salamandrivorans]|nr:hypothetical protein BASA81_001193 [Batrachochytrium salamandrivorans]